MSHTPAPWTFDEMGEQLTAADGTVIVECGNWGSSSETEDESTGNAALIAAAPELREALKNLVSAAEQIPVKSHSQVVSINLALAALRKAGGAA